MVNKVLSQPRITSATVNILRPMLPYCLHPLDSFAPSPLIWLNRNYKPLGTMSGHANYHEYPWLHVDRDDPFIAKLLPYCREIVGLARQPIFFLYDDFTAPRNRKSLTLYNNLLGRVDTGCA